MAGERSYGMEFWVGANEAASTATVQVAGIAEITPPEQSRDSIDISTHGSGGVREFLPGPLLDNGEITLDLNWIPGDATDDVLVAMLGEDGSRFFEIRCVQLTTPQKYSGRGFVTSKSPSTPMEDKMTCSVTLKVTGALTGPVAI